MDQNKELQYITALRQAAEKIKELSPGSTGGSSRHIAVVGVGCRYPGGADNPDLFWDLLVNGRSTSGEFPVDRVEWLQSKDQRRQMIEDYRMHGSFLADLEYFDSAFFHITPKEAVSIDPHHKLLLETSWQAFENGGLVPQSYKGSRTGVYVGISGIDYSRAQMLAGDYNSINAYTLNGIVLNSASGRLSYFYDFHGPSVSLDTACSSGLIALHQALHALQAQEIDMAMVCGVNAICLPEIFISLTKMNALSPEGICRAFDDQANGFARGEGCGVLLLKRMKDAQKAGDRIWALIRGMAVNNDGRSSGMTAPSGPAQVRVIRDGHKAADIQPDEVDYLEAHGTGTKLGDPVEIESLAQVFQKRSKEKPLYIGSVKTNIGHQESGAGVAGLIKVILALQHEEIPRSLHLNTPNAHIPWSEIPIKVAAANRDWKRGARKRLAGISSFGFSGTNAHVIVEEAPQTMDPDFQDQDRSRQVLAVSGFDAQGLKALTQIHLKRLESISDEALPDYCYSTNAARQQMAFRAAWTARSVSELTARMADWLAAAGDADSPARSEPRIAFLFTGQGSQYKGMGSQLWRESPAFRASIERCDAAFAPHLDCSISALLYDEAIPAEQLDQTKYTQPLLFSFGYSLAHLLISWGVTPELMIGHSIGEYCAACLAGVFDLKSAADLVAERGRLMQSLPPGGAMLAAHLSASQAEELIRSFNGSLSLAAVNAPQSVTISGRTESIEQVERRLTQDKVKFQRLATSHAFHSALMDPILAQFSEKASAVGLFDPQIPIVLNRTGKVSQNGEITRAAYWTDQLRHTVRFSDCVAAAWERKINCFVEIGGNSTLIPLARKCLPEAKPLFLPALLKNEDNWEALLRTVCALYEQGVEIDWRAFDKPYGRRFLNVPNYLFNKQYLWKKPITGQPDFGNSTSTPLPLTPSIENRTLPMAPAQPVSDQGRHSRQDRVLNQIKAFVQHISGISADSVDADANLFYLGLDSLTLIDLQTKVQSFYNVQLDVKELFEKLNTIRLISDHVAEISPVMAKAPKLESPPVRTSPPAAPEITIPAPSGDLMAVVSTQLQIMQRQLELLASSGKDSAQVIDTIRQALPAAPPVSAPAAPPPPHEHRRAWDKFNPVRALIFQDDELDARQVRYIADFARRYNAKTAKSKAYAETNRKWSADWITSLGYRKSIADLVYPLVSARSKGSQFTDIDGNDYVDIAMGYGVHFFGHQPSFVVEAIQKQLEEGFELGPQSDLVGENARLLCEMTSTERCFFTNSGTESVMAAVRLARAVTGRNKVVLFSGSFHGTFDGILAYAEGEETQPFSPGTPWNLVSDIKVLTNGSEDSLEYIRRHRQEIGAVLVEPVQSRRPGLQPAKFLSDLRTLTAESGMALIFDEMITGFRIHPGGAQHHFGIKADLITYGKIIGGGMPIGAVAGSSEYLDAVDGGWWSFGGDSQPNRVTMVFGGTFCKHPLSMAATRAVLEELKKSGPQLQERVNGLTAGMAQRINDFFESAAVPVLARHFGSVLRFESFGKYDLARFPIEMDLLFFHMMLKGVYTWERRICFLSAAHAESDIEMIIRSVKESIHELREGGFSFSNDAL